ncbi:hypothetical protein QZH41_005476 [Actinostola sp. cb2023]|nr:hypothetical protein QZH41_005476 [Actinostola sp. cb2023]
MFYEGYWFSTSLGSTVAYLFISFVTVFGNLLVFASFIRDPYRQLRTLQNYFIVNLAVSDLAMGCFAETLLAATYWENRNDVFFAHYLCAIMSGVSSLLNMAALSIYRYFVIKNPFTYHGITTKKRIIITIVIIWLYTLHFAALPLAGWKTSGYQLYLYLLGCTLPSVVIVFTYLGVFLAIRAHTRHLKSTIDSKNKALQNAVNREKATTKTMLIILGVFIAFWVPFLIIDIIMVQCQTCRSNYSIHAVRDIALTLTYFSSGINPLLYAWRVQQFRKAFIRILGLDKLRCLDRRRNRIEVVDTNTLKLRVVSNMPENTAWVVPT